MKNFGTIIIQYGKLIMTKYNKGDCMKRKEIFYLLILVITMMFFLGGCTASTLLEQDSLSNRPHSTRN